MSDSDKEKAGKERETERKSETKIKGEKGRVRQR